MELFLSVLFILAGIVNVIVLFRAIGTPLRAKETMDIIEKIAKPTPFNPNEYRDTEK